MCSRRCPAVQQPLLRFDVYPKPTAIRRVHRRRTSRAPVPRASCEGHHILGRGGPGGGVVEIAQARVHVSEEEAFGYAFGYAAENTLRSARGCCCCSSSCSSSSSCSCSCCSCCSSPLLFLEPPLSLPLSLPLIALPHCPARSTSNRRSRIRATASHPTYSPTKTFRSS
jgi:hypothetical protein